ncbi:hypothetical protein CBR_g41571 [Chara braunii]|uniref:Uncharacterized protein n=1 Tax=Chara braunii TaxID=69332 RepID=A0A388K2U2_CHABU|nr:hypothetical protein CBR_g41571 [Chara braunii]|eukprot:GBG64370.1 hypothetical protein CBR_g41571 [Chara braunii]
MVRSVDMEGKDKSYPTWARMWEEAIRELGVHRRACTLLEPVYALDEGHGQRREDGYAGVVFGDHVGEENGHAAHGLRDKGVRDGEDFGVSVDVQVRGTAEHADGDIGADMDDLARGTAEDTEAAGGDVVSTPDPGLGLGEGFASLLHHVAPIVASGSNKDFREHPSAMSPMRIDFEEQTPDWARFTGPTPPGLQLSKDIPTEVGEGLQGMVYRRRTRAAEVGGPDPPQHVAARRASVSPPKIDASKVRQVRSSAGRKKGGKNKPKESGIDDKRWKRQGTQDSHTASDLEREACCCSAGEEEEGTKSSQESHRSQLMLSSFAVSNLWNFATLKSLHESFLWRRRAPLHVDSNTCFLFTVEQFKRPGSDLIRGVDIHPREPWILTSVYWKGVVEIWDYERQGLVYDWKVSHKSVRAAKFIDQKEWIVVGGEDNSIRVYDVKSHDLVKMFVAHQHWVYDVAVHPSRPYVLSCSRDETIKLWDWEKDWDPITFHGHLLAVKQVSFHPQDPNIFASASDDRTIKVWDYESESCKATLIGHGSDVYGACFHPHFPYIFTGSKDETVRVWNGTDYRLEKTLESKVGSVWIIATCKTSDMIAVGGLRGAVLFDVRVIQQEGLGLMQHAQRTMLPHGKMSLSPGMVAGIGFPASINSSSMQGFQAADILARDMVRTFP